MRHLGFLLLYFVCVYLVSADGSPRYVFLFIGDGMGENHVRVADAYHRAVREASGFAGDDEDGSLALLQLPYRGSLSTFSKSRMVTDSAASASAFSTGRKVPRNALNYDSDLDVEYQPLADYLNQIGYKVGIISSAPINHATPAGFYAVAADRDNYSDIARQMASSSVDYFGGESLMGMSGELDSVKAQARRNGFAVIESPDSFGSLLGESGKVWVSSPMPYRVDAAHEISLADHTAKAIDILDGAERFFIMVEGAKIDWASHANDSVTMIRELLEMDAAVAVALSFLKEHPEETLLIVTADHETGGLMLPETVSGSKLVSLLGKQRSSLAEMEPLFQELEDAGVDFTLALPRMQKWFGIEELSAHESARIEEAYAIGGDESGKFRYGGEKRLGHVWARILGERVGMRWTSVNHTEARVPVYAMGVQADRFAGFSDNALIGGILRELLINSHLERQ
jgi:alkaline phosphatase